MTAPTPPAKYVYKILDAAPPSPLPTILPLTDLDKADGFIHLSTAVQVPATAALFFAANPTLWVLKLRLPAIAAGVKWEQPPGSGSSASWFPHLYGDFGAREVEAVEVVARGEGEEWKGVFAAAGWLE